MTAWQVAEDRHRRSWTNHGFISRRVPTATVATPAEGWPYNLYTMIHGKSETDCRETARQIAEKAGLQNLSATI